MKYFDSGSRDPAHTLASWLEDILNGDVAELRLQTGFFSLDGIGLLVPALERCKANDFPTHMLIGSNDAGTLKDDVLGLVDTLGIPRDRAKLGIVSFGGAYFHPKVYHMKRPDGSQAAFVGSANLTASGLALHVEAGIALDTRDGDAPDHLSQIAAAIDRWFSEQRTGMSIIAGRHSVDELVETGVLALARPPRVEPQARNDGLNGRVARPRLQRLFVLPAVRPPVTQPQTAITAPVVAPAIVPAQAVAHLQSVPRNGFPQYLLFEPNATGPTNGATALTGSFLPGGAVGLIVQLNRDSARHFAGRQGTANISIPVTTVSTLRFGVAGKHDGPTARFGLKLRYIDDNASIEGGTLMTSVKGYGYTAGETGHGDIRMVVPKAVQSLKEETDAAGKIPPAANDLAFLEWPTLQNPAFHLTFIDTHSTIYQQAVAAFSNAEATGQLVGKGACWLPAGVSPNW